MWFNQPYIASYVPQDSPVKVTGTVGGSAERPYITNPEVEAVPAGMIPEGLFEQDAPQDMPKIFPVYPESRGITSRWFFHALERVFAAGVHSKLGDPIPAYIRDAYHLPDLATALVYIHAPEKHTHAEAARKRFAFEEIFTIQIARAQERYANSLEPSFPLQHADANVEEVPQYDPLSTTGAQRRAMSDIFKSFAEPHPMARLLEGDVGAGQDACCSSERICGRYLAPARPHFGYITGRVHGADRDPRAAAFPIVHRILQRHANQHRAAYRQRLHEISIQARKR